MSDITVRRWGSGGMAGLIGSLAAAALLAGLGAASCGSSETKCTDCAGGAGGTGGTTTTTTSSTTTTSVLTCEAGQLDCDGDASNGCEATSPCENGGHCAEAAGCSSGNCEDGFCAGPPVIVDLAGNAFVTTAAPNGTEAIDDINNTGLGGWSSTSAVISTYVWVTKPGPLGLGLVATPGDAPGATVRLSALGKSFDVQIQSAGAVRGGTVDVPTAGYLKIDLQGISKTGSTFGEVKSLELRGPANEAMVYADDPANYYWSRRGPSVHLVYDPTGVEYFYGEVKVPPGEDTIGSYFMVTGFSEGYAGIQVKSETERWIIFSVWDPAQGQTTLVRKGPNVTAGNFGGEGTGGQSYLVFPWVAGTTYKFLTKAQPDGAGATNYTNWFHAPENGQWVLMAEWTRPNTTTHLGGLYSFVEGFLSDNGYLGRKALFGNQWVRAPGGSWTEVTSAYFDGDATAKNEQRLDFDGGVEGGLFMLRNGGFFSDGGEAYVTLNRPATGTAPNIDLASLP